MCVETRAAIERVAPRTHNARKRTANITPWLWPIRGFQCPAHRRFLIAELRAIRESNGLMLARWLVNIVESNGKHEELKKKKLYVWKESRKGEEK